LQVTGAATTIKERSIKAAATTMTTGTNQAPASHLGYERDYNQSPKDIVNGPCNMHYTFIDEKRVSNHMMKDCRTFIRLQEVVGSKQAEAQNQGYTGTPASVTYNTLSPPLLPANGATQTQEQHNTNN
jgi:hypothetical protein